LSILRARAPRFQAHNPAQEGYLIGTIQSKWLDDKSNLPQRLYRGKIRARLRDTSLAGLVCCADI